MSDEQTGEPADQKKIIIDEDWKSQVRAEKEAARHEDQEEAPEPGPEQAEPGELPPASFPLLVTDIITQPLISMGQVPDPVDGKSVVRLDLARHSIDILAMLQDKTKGNLTGEEEQMLEDALHQLRMLFVTVQGQATGAKPEPADDDK